MKFRGTTVTKITPPPPPTQQFHWGHPVPNLIHVRRESQIKRADWTAGRQEVNVQLLFHVLRAKNWSLLKHFKFVPPAHQDTKQIFPILRNVQTCCGAHVTSYPMGSYTGVKRPGSEVQHSPPRSAMVKNNCCNYNSSPLRTFTAWTRATLQCTSIATRITGPKPEPHLPAEHRQ